jgi:DNA-binding MarR family transcriptional regulator
MPHKGIRAVKPSEPDLLEKWLKEWTHEHAGLDPSIAEIFARLRRVALFLGAAPSRIAATQGIKTGEFILLTWLRHAGPPYELKPTALCDALSTTKSGITKRIDRLVALGMVERRTNPKDRRSVPVRLTPQGLRVAQAQFRITKEPEYQLLLKLPLIERRAFAGLLRGFSALIPRRAHRKLSG